MKICIVGAGAIGGLLGAKLALAGGCEVSAIARGQTLRALQDEGWRLRSGSRLERAPAKARAAPAELGPQDVVIVAVKAPALAQVAQHIAPLLGPTTAVVPAMNGVPWWFVEGLPAFDGAPLACVDPGGLIGAAIATERVIGCVVHAAASMPEPGLVEHRHGRGLILGEPGGAASERVGALAALFNAAGFDATVSTRIRHDIWYKLWGNLTMNPVSAITGATLDRMLDDPLVRDFCSAAMREATAIGARIGCHVDQSPDDRHAVTRQLGSVRTSMLQDVEAGRPIELDAIVGAVHEIAARLGEPAPCIGALLGLTRLFARGRGLYPDATAAP